MSGGPRLPDSILGYRVVGGGQRGELLGGEGGGWAALRLHRT